MTSLRVRSGLFCAIAVSALAGCGGDAGETPSASAPAAQAIPPTKPSNEPAATGRGATGEARISGVVQFEGKVPIMKPMDMNADPGCAKKHATAPASEALVLGEGNTMGNVLVRVSSGASGAYAAPSTPAVIDQQGCRYVPHVLGLMVGQPLKIANSDGLLHNVHALPAVNQEFNIAMPGSRTETETRFDRAEDPFKIKCDVHPWMGAYIAVMDHPFFDVTDADGAFDLAGLPAGEYRIEAWHERLGSLVETVTLADGGTQEIRFTFGL